MKTSMTHVIRLTFLLTAFLMALPGLAAAVDVPVALQAAPTTIAVPGSAPIAAWGFGFANVSTTTVPGPKLEVASGDNLVITLTNKLPVPVSIVVPGQSIVPTPVSDNSDGMGMRVRSFTVEAAANGGTATYTFTNMKPGTFLYESGTNPAVQISMGLYGALVVKPTAVPPAANNAYIDNANVSSAYDAEAVLLFSEVDTDLNTAVSAAPTAPYSTINSKPKYFLINGRSFPDTLDVLAPAGVNTLFRMINAGTRSHTPTIAGLYMTVIAEDGNLRNYAKTEFAPALPPGKTLDAIVVNTAGGLYPLYDRSLGLVNGASVTTGAPAAGGMLTFVNFNAAAPPPPGAPACTPHTGDVDGNGIVDVADALAALQAAVSVPYVYIPVADVAPLTGTLPCGNGKIDVLDAVLILEKVAGLTPF